MKKHWFWMIEVLIWLLILFLVSGGIMFARYNYRKNFNTYQIFLTDVDGLIAGSPVKLMGIQVGYVNQIDIVGEDVYVKFIITESKVKVPPGSVVTVEFSGLGGSKSLEIYPPTKAQPSSGKFIIVQSPKRLNDSFGVLNDMFEQIAELTYTVSNFMDEVGVIQRQKCYNEIGINSADGILNDANNWLDRAQKQCERFGAFMKRKNEVKDGKNNNKDDK